MLGTQPAPENQPEPVAMKVRESDRIEREPKEKYKLIFPKVAITIISGACISHMPAIPQYKSATWTMTDNY